MADPDDVIATVDPDVIAEKERVDLVGANEGCCQESACLGIPSRQCFGLLSTLFVV